MSDEVRPKRSFSKVVTVTRNSHGRRREAAASVVETSQTRADIRRAPTDRATELQPYGCDGKPPSNGRGAS